MIIECQTCPVRGDRCAACMVTAMAANAPIEVQIGRGDAQLSLDRRERQAIGVLVGAGLIGSTYAASLTAELELPSYSREAG